MTEKWLFALVQHPMILIVSEDRGIPKVGERIPEWGAPDLEAYIARIWRNLEALRIYPDLKLNYEISAVELRIIARHSPAILTAMRKMIREGRLAFVGGDYSQAHGQLFSGELNFRQLEKGLEVFEKLLGYKITNNFHQETCLHDQMPQLLKAFGFLTASPPVFTHTLVSLDPLRHPHFVYADNTGYQMLAADSVALWKGLDGTELPIVVTGVSIGGFKPDRIRIEAQKGLYRSSRIIITAPDMEEIDEERYRLIKTMGDTTLLDDAVLNEVNRQKPNWKVKLDTYWSYSEGEWAEAVYRKIRQAESTLISEETLAAVKGAFVRKKLEDDWETVLTAMHHDIHWVEVTDLKSKYIAKMDKVIKRSKKREASLLRGNTDITGYPVIRIANTLAYRRSEIIRFTIRGRNTVRILSLEGEEIPSMCIPSWHDENCLDVFFAVNVPSLGTADFFITNSEKDPERGVECSRAVVKAGEGKYIIEDNGTVSEASVCGLNILSGYGHDLRYLTNEGITVGGASRTGKMKRYSGMGIDVLRIDAPIGEIPVELEYVASPFNRYLIISTRLHFSNNEVGKMWDDRSKLNSYWNVNGKKIRYGIPYGAADGLETVPLYSPYWISVTGGNGGLAVINKGTPKHFVENGVIGCVWAWGGRTFSNRMHLSWLKKDMYDLTLKDTQVVDSGAMVIRPEASEAETMRAAQCLNMPMQAVGTPKINRIGFRKHIPDFSKTGLVITAITLRDGKLTGRFYEAEGKSYKTEAISYDLESKIRVTDLTGRELNEIAPYRIGYISF